MNLSTVGFKFVKIFICLLTCLLVACDTQNLVLRTNYDNPQYKDSSLMKKGLYVDNIIDKRYENNKIREFFKSK